jgi:hypothetical protein
VTVAAMGGRRLEITSPIDSSTSSSYCQSVDIFVLTAAIVGLLAFENETKIA